MRLQRQQWDAELPETFGQLRETVLIIRLVRLPSAGHTGVQLGVRDAIGHRIETRLREAGFQRIAHCDGHDLFCARQAPEGREMFLLRIRLLASWRNRIDILASLLSNWKCAS